MACEMAPDRAKAWLGRINESLRITFSHTPRRVFRQGLTEPSESLAYLYLQIVVYALRRARLNSESLFGVLLLIGAPIMYIFGFKGVLQTPIGKFGIDSRKEFRITVYGYFKSVFSYVEDAKTAGLPLEGDTLVDVGTNVGAFAVQMRTRFRKLVIIDPAAEFLRRAEMNLRINDMNQVYRIERAAHDKSEELQLGGDGSNLYVGGSRHPRKVSGDTLDSILEHHAGIISLVKVDVQGHELHVIRGMQSLLSEGKIGLLMVEVHCKRGVNEMELTRDLHSAGYELVYRSSYLFGQPHLYFARPN